MKRACLGSETGLLHWRWAKDGALAWQEAGRRPTATLPVKP